MISKEEYAGAYEAGGVLTENDRNMMAAGR
jgi:hypothetical protein